MRNYNDWSQGEVDELTGFTSAIASDHAYIHKGKAYTYNIILDLDAGDTRELMLATPPQEANRFIHLRPVRIATSASGVIYYMFEESAVGATTDATVDVWNRNRNTWDGIVPPKSHMYSDVTVNSDGRLLETLYIGEGGSRRNSAGGDSSADEEILLRPLTNYIFRFYNDGSLPTKVSFNLFWYEEQHRTT